MRGMCHKAIHLTGLWFLAALLIPALPAPSAAKDHGDPVLRWTEGQSGCTFSADDDGKYRYGLWTDDFGITVAVDSLELQKAVRRIEPLFALWLTVRYRGSSSTSLNPDVISLGIREARARCGAITRSGESCNQVADRR